VQQELDHGRLGRVRRVGREQPDQRARCGAVEILEFDLIDD
jgi:hypothetical protein